MDNPQAVGVRQRAPLQSAMLPRAPPPPTIVQTRPHPLLALRLLTVLGLAAVISLGTLYSLLADTAQSEYHVQTMKYSTPTVNYFANKYNIFNQLFVKRAWLWTSLAFAALYGTAPPGIRPTTRLARYAIATAAWLAFTTWFFGPAVMDRLHVLSGGECVLTIPPPSLSALVPPSSTEPILVPVPASLCYARAPLSPETHPSLFAAPFIPPTPESFHVTPRIHRGHDVSGHIFLLTLAVLFLVDELAPSLPFLYKSAEPRVTAARPSQAHLWATRATIALVGLWVWMTLMTSVYFHTPQEKLTGFLMGLGAFALSQIPLPTISRAPPVVPADVAADVR